ncbi:MAG: DUF2920 family protein [Syntrophomonadaceae bacterium]|nr:DUF2920 family protein [Syntrophomonadaceae bacterium]
MSNKSNFSFPAHPDIELGWKRKTLEAFLDLPDKIDDNTGLIIFSDGWGGFANSDYQNNKLRPYLADKYNCIVAGVNYFGIYRGTDLVLKEEFFHNIRRIYGINLSPDSFKNAQTKMDVYSTIAVEVLKKGCTSLDIRCQPTLVTGNDEYQSWGLLPAIDNLCMVGEILKRYPINSRRIMAYGSSYGGYISLLMGKYAPNTFSVIIDKAGFSRALLKHIVGGEVHEADYLVRLAVEGSPYPFIIHCGCNNPWTIEDETSPQYFSDSHKMIRSLLVDKHRQSSECRYYIFQSVEDDISPIDDKDRCVDILKNYNQVYYKRVTHYDLNGGIYKNLQHDMGVSVTGLFDYVADMENHNFYKSNPDTDFSLDLTHRFKCGSSDYVFYYDKLQGLTVKIENV